MPNTYDEELYKLWRTAYQSGDPRRALALAIAGYLIASEDHDDMREEVFLGLIRQSVTAPNPLPRERVGLVDLRCSFCGRDGTEAQLVAGAAANICSQCVVQIGETMKHK